LGACRSGWRPGAWSEVRMPLNDHYERGNLVHVRLDTKDGVDVQAVGPSSGDDVGDGRRSATVAGWNGVGRW
jgi:hypothetical protein